MDWLWGLGENLLLLSVILQQLIHGRCVPFLRCSLEEKLQYLSIPCEALLGIIAS